MSRHHIQPIELSNWYEHDYENELRARNFTCNRPYNGISGTVYQHIGLSADIETKVVFHELPVGPDYIVDPEIDIMEDRMISCVIIASLKRALQAAQVHEAA